MSRKDMPVVIEAAVSLEKAGGIAVLADSPSTPSDTGSSSSGISDRCLYQPTLDGARASLATHPHVLIYAAPLLASATHAEVHQHYPALAQAGCLTMIAVEPGRTALDAYLETLEGVDLPWLIATQGDNVLDTPVARYALEMGGHIRVGEEDVSGTTPLRNSELVEAAIALAASVGRPVVSGADARAYLTGR